MNSVEAFDNGAPRRFGHEVHRELVGFSGCHFGDFMRGHDFGEDLDGSLFVLRPVPVGGNAVADSELEPISVDQICRDDVGIRFEAHGR